MPNDSSEDKQTKSEYISKDGSVVYPAEAWEYRLAPPSWHVRYDTWTGINRWTTKA